MQLLPRLILKANSDDIVICSELYTENGAAGFGPVPPKQN